MTGGHGCEDCGGRCGAGCDGDVEVEINAVEGSGVEPRTRMSGMVFAVADVRKPLAAAAKVVAAGNRVVLAPDGSFVENLSTGEKLKLREERGVYVMDVEYDSGKTGCITLDSGAGVSVWPKQLGTEGLMPAEKGLKMVAANGTEIKNLGTKLVKFKAIAGGASKEVFRWRP